MYTLSVTGVCKDIDGNTVNDVTTYAYNLTKNEGYSNHYTDDGYYSITIKEPDKNDKILITNTSKDIFNRFLLKYTDDTVVNNITLTDEVVDNIISIKKTSRGVYKFTTDIQNIYQCLYVIMVLLISIVKNGYMLRILYCIRR